MKTKWEKKEFKRDRKLYERKQLNQEMRIKYNCLRTL